MPAAAVGEQVVAAAADGVVLGGGKVVGGTVVVVGGTVVGGAVVIGGCVEVVVVTTAFTVGFVATGDDEHSAAPRVKAATATRATRLICATSPSSLFLCSRAVRLLGILNLNRVGIVLANALLRTKSLITHRGPHFVLQAVLAVTFACWAARASRIA